MAITKLQFEFLRNWDYVDEYQNEIEIDTFNDVLLNEDIVFGSSNKMRIVGIIDTGLDYEEYLPLNDFSKGGSVGELADLLEEYRSLLYDNLIHNSLFLCDDAVVTMRYSFTQRDNVTEFSGRTGTGYGSSPALLKENEVVYKEGYTGQLGEDDVVVSRVILARAIFTQNVPSVDLSFMTPTEKLFVQRAISDEDLAANDEMLNEYFGNGITINFSLSRQETGTEELEPVRKTMNVVGYFKEANDVFRHDNTIAISQAIIDEYLNERDMMCVFSKLTKDKQTDNKLFKHLVGNKLKKDEKVVKTGVESILLYSRDYSCKNVKTYRAIFASIFFVFTVLMVMLFFNLVIKAKRKDIGILCALGARKNEVFLIFLAEALIIVLITYPLGMLGSWGLVKFFNNDFIKVAKEADIDSIICGQIG
jgi:ABC-type antimicrobial peptide transport system, permease component